MPKSIQDVIESMETEEERPPPPPVAATPAPPMAATFSPLPSAGMTVTRNLAGKGEGSTDPWRSGDGVGTGEATNKIIQQP